MRTFPVVRILSIGLCGLAFMALPVVAQEGGPTVTSVSPNTGDVAGGIPVTITGTGFTGVKSVTFGIIGSCPPAKAKNVKVVNETTITAIAPGCSANGQGNVEVSTATGRTPANTAFTYTGTDFAPAAEGAADKVPTVTAVSPASGSDKGGTKVTITGTNFTGVTDVTFGIIGSCPPSPARDVTVVSDTTITATTPACTADGKANVEVTNDSGRNTANTLFTFEQ